MTPSRFLHTPLLDLLQCRLPIMLAGMGGVARFELAAAVANAGGFGVLGMVREPVELIRAQVRALRQKTQSRFGVNLIPAATDPALLRSQVAACLSLEVPTMVLFWDVDTALIKHLKQEGVQVIHQVGSQQDAEAALNAGVDVLIAQGHEAGGHVRGTCSTQALLADIVGMSPIPVVASGGIGSGRALVSALTLGAQGVSLGTALLATHEANAHPHHKQRVLHAKGEDTVYTTQFSRNWHEPAPVRVLANAVTAGKYSKSDAETIIGHQDGQDVYLYSTDSPLADATGNIDDMALYCGQSCGQLRGLCSVRDRVDAIIDEATTVFERFYN